MSFKMLPSVVIEYLGDNKITLKNDINGTVEKQLLSTTDYEVWKNDTEDAQRRAVVREMVSLARLMALPANRFHANKIGAVYRVNLIIPYDWWANETLQWLMNYVSHLNHRNANSGTYVHLDGYTEILPETTTSLIYITRRKEEQISTEDHKVDPKEAFLKKIADYIGDQDISYVIITTKAGAQIRVDP